MNTLPTEEFEQLIRHKTPNELIPFLASLEKAAVPATREKLKSLKKELDKMVELSPNGWGSKGTYEQFENLFLAGFALYSRREALGGAIGSAWLLGSNPNAKPILLKQHFLALVRALRPEWLHDWLLRQQAAASEWALDYQLLRTLEQEQLIPYSPALTARSLPNALARWGWELSDSAKMPLNATEVIAANLSRDHLLLTRDLPLIFEFENPVPNAWARVQPPMPLNQKGERQNGQEAHPWQVWNEKFPPQTVGWQTLLTHLTTTRHLDRADILTRCLLALRRDFRRPLLTWFKELFLSLKPTRAERLARQSELTDLLAHPLPLVVNFAIEQLKDVWPEPGFTLAPLLHYADSLLLRPDLKTSLKTLLAGLAKLPRQQPAHAPAVARLLAAALTHPDAAVQERAAKALADLLAARPPLLAPAATAETLVTLAGQAELLGPAARTVLVPWLAAAEPAPAVATATYAPLTRFVPDISPATAIAPVADWHELLFLTGQVLRHDDPPALERWLDGLLRLHAQLPAGHAGQLEPYLVLVLPFLKGKSDAQAQAILGTNGLRGHSGLAQALLLSWAQGFSSLRVPRVQVQTDADTSDPLVLVEKQRLAAAEQQLQQRTGLPLLSTPTHAPHWVAPATLVQKLLAYETARHEPEAADLALALARLAFAHDAAAQAAQELLPQLQNTALRELLAWVLSPSPAAGQKTRLPQGAERLPGPTAAGSVAEALPWLWAVAARTKFPTHAFADLLPAGAAEYPGVTQPWQPRWEFEFKVNTVVENWKPGRPEVTYRATHLVFPDKYTSQRPPSPLLVYALHARFRGMAHGCWSLGPDYPFLAALLPLHPAPLHWHVVRTAGWADKLESAERDAIAQALQTLLATGPVFAEATSLLLAVGLLHHTAACRALAQEVLLRAVAGQRLVPTALGHLLGQLLAADYAPVARLADGLPQLRAVSPTTDDALAQTLDALLPELPAAPLRNLRKLLETYADLMDGSGRPLPTPVRARLSEWSQATALKKLTAVLLPNG